MTISVAANKWPYRVPAPIDPSAVLSYGIDWSGWIPKGATIQTADWTITGGAEEHSAIVDNVTYVWLSVTTGAAQVTVNVHIILDTSPVALEDERTLLLTVKDR